MALLPCRGPGLSSWHPCNDSIPPATPVPGNPATMLHINSCKETHINKIKISLKKSKAERAGERSQKLGALVALAEDTAAHNYL